MLVVCLLLRHFLFSLRKGALQRACREIWTLYWLKVFSLTQPTSSLRDLSFWCYECDSYVKHPALQAIYNKIHVLKFGVHPGQQATKEESAAVRAILGSNISSKFNEQLPQRKKVTNLPAMR